MSGKEIQQWKAMELPPVTYFCVFLCSQLVLRPDVVEMHDVTAHDPKLLVHLKVG